MLINCPRCGFQQPKDKYCAQCGVDMESFKPATPPLWKRVFGNPLIQLSLLVVIAGGVGISLYQKGQQNLERRVNYLKSTVQINPSPNTAPAAGPEAAEPSPTDQASQEPQVDAKNDAADGVVTAYKVAAPAPAASPTASATASPTGTEKSARAVAKNEAHLVVYYAEVGRGSLNAIMGASRNTGQFMNFNDYAAGILPTVDSNINRPQITILHKEERALDGAGTIQWSYSIKDRRDPTIEIGLTTFFEINEIEGNTLRGNLEIQRTWKDPTPSGNFEVQRKSFPAIFEIGGRTGFFLAGVMPAQSNLENDDELTAIDVFKILRSPRFRAGDSEFVIFIEFVKGN
ncbi:MAG: hypothetical protein OM95_05110 [Bdellovibrio sp. ArHS]|uniref:hypothetical protein n=1 Tax=Bdellovibrio sp. ArHS TaxID=1569284 RepID=UPI0005825411|nr:hypothetical protein [Bdellovibrio sp. ArHS]KHD89195.1 MAG: hypothetical protein OM95_05110 [Bdellovibrio sp. ArHS]